MFFFYHYFGKKGTFATSQKNIINVLIFYLYDKQKAIANKSNANLICIL